MPGFPGFDPLDPFAGTSREKGFSVGFVSVAGDKYSMRFSKLGGAVDLVANEHMLTAQAAGALSNMGVYALREDKVTELPIPDAEAADEAHSGPTVVAAFYFQNNDGEIMTVDVPAPDATLFESDGVTVKPRTDPAVGSLIGDFIDAAELSINSTWLPANSFAFTHGIRRVRNIKLPSGGNVKPTIIEGAGATAGPGT